MDVAHFRAWDMNARVIIQAGGTFTGDQINIDVQSSYNSALANGRAGPVLEVKRTEGHSGGRFTQVRIGCHNSNRQPILQVYFNGGATHNSAGSVTVTVHDYGSNYGSGAYRGEAKFATATTLNEIWESLDIDESGCDYFNTSTTPAFSAFKHDNSGQIGSGTYAFNSQTLDRGGDNYNTSNGRFTAPCDGVYYFIATLQMYGGSSTVHARFQKNGVDVYNQGTNTTSNISVNSYLSLILHVGFDERKHGYINPCNDMINDYHEINNSSRDQYKPAKFYPTNPSNENAGNCNILGKLDESKWHHQIIPPNNGSWWNNEAQHYTNSTKNSIVSDGTLKIIAIKENYTVDNSTKNYTM